MMEHSYTHRHTHEYTRARIHTYTHTNACLDATVTGRRSVNVNGSLASSA